MQGGRRGRRRCLGFIQQQARARKYPAVAGNINAAKAFLRKAMKGQPVPTNVTLDANAASHRAVADLKNNGELAKRVRVRSSKYLNNVVEQDHRRIQYRLRPMWGLKSVESAEVVIGGIELVDLGGRTATMPEIWQAALAS